MQSLDVSIILDTVLERHRSPQAVYYSTFIHQNRFLISIFIHLLQQLPQCKYFVYKCILVMFDIYLYIIMWYYIVFIVISDGLVTCKQDWESPGTRSFVVIGQERRNEYDNWAYWEWNRIFCSQHLPERPSCCMWVLAGDWETPSTCKRHLSCVKKCKETFTDIGGKSGWQSVVALCIFLGKKHTGYVRLYWWHYETACWRSLS